MRRSLLATVLVALVCVPAMAQTTTTFNPGLTVTARLGDVRTPHQVTAIGVAPGSPQSVLVFAPDGQQTSLQAQASDAGQVSWTLDPPWDGWQLGLYRVVLPTGSGRAISEMFVAGDGQPHLVVEPYLPSPTSALDLSGFGLASNGSLALQLTLTGGLGQKTLEVQTDDAGSFSVFVWPQQLGLPFFAAGDYKLTALNLGLSTDFRVREHPVSSAITVDGPILRGNVLPLTLHNYAANRSVWGVYADANGHALGEFVVGPTDVGGSYSGAIVAALPAAGHYLIATPYDWGESAFDTIDPTATPSATPTLTPVPPTATPTVKPSPGPTKVALSKKCHGKYARTHRKLCSRRP